MNLISYPAEDYHHFSVLPQVVGMSIDQPLLSDIFPVDAFFGERFGNNVDRDVVIAFLTEAWMGQLEICNVTPLSQNDSAISRHVGMKLANVVRHFCSVFFKDLAIRSDGQGVSVCVCEGIDWTV